jgi:hypothetical protein
MSKSADRARAGLPYFETARENIYSIAGSLRPGAIKDQINRGGWIVRWMHEQNILSSLKPVLIVGGGAGGMSAALQALTLNIPCVLLACDADSKAHGQLSDPVEKLFPAQGHCRSRFLEPTAYEWFDKHWDKHRFRADRRFHPLGYKREVASEIALKWRMAAAEIAARSANKLLVLSTRRFATADEIVTRDDKAWRFVPAVLESLNELNPGYPTLDVKFAAVIIATGTGAEKRVENYPRTDPADEGFCSKPFWSTDKIDHPSYGCAEPPQRVLISGGGDGGMQDALRFILQRRWRDIANLVNKLEIPPRLLKDLSLEQGSGCVQNTRIDATSKQVARDYVQWISTRGMLNGLLQDLLRPNRPEVDLVFYHNHLHGSYPINRFMLHLLHELTVMESVELARKPKLNFVADTEVIGVKHIAHEPLGASSQDRGAGHCWGKPHRAMFRARSSCAHSHGPVELLESPHEYQIVIIRHGTNQQLLDIGKRLQTDRTEKTPTFPPKYSLSFPGDFL